MRRQTSLTGDRLKVWQRTGSKGGTVTSKRYSRKQRIAWGARGGRPRGKHTEAILKILRRGPKSRREIHKLLPHIDLVTISLSLNNMRKSGQVINCRKGGSLINTGKWKLKKPLPFRRKQDDTPRKSQTEDQDRQQIAV